MKKECNVVRDLMVLYELENCSDESVQMIKEHIENCEECRKIWESKSEEEIEQVIEEVKNEDGKEEFNKLRKRVRRKNILKILVIAFVLSCFMYCGYRFISRPVACDIEDIEFSNFYEENGEIGFKATLIDGKGFGEHSGFYSGGSAKSDYAVQIELYRSRFSPETTKEKEISMYVTVPSRDGGTKEIYYGEGDGKILIWQEGDPISELTDEIREDMNNILAGGME